MSHFYGTEFEILAGFGLIDSTENQVVHWNLFDLTLYKGLWVVVYLLNGHLSKDLAPKMGYQYQAYFCFQSKFSLNMASLVFGLFSVPK